MSHQILIISSEFPPGPGGIGQHAYSLAKALHSEGYHVKVLSPADYVTSEEVKAFDKKQPYVIKRYKRLASFFTYYKRLRSTLSEIRKTRVRFVVLTGKFSLWQGLIIKLFYSNIKTLAILHGSEINLPNYILRHLTHFSISSADIIIPVSYFTKSLLPNWILRIHKNIFVIPNGIEQELFTDNTLSDIKLEGIPKLLTIGHVSPRKGQQRVIKALPRLISSWPHIHYHIVGRPNNQSLLENLAVQLGVQDHITFHGRVADHQNLGLYYREADVFLLLSENQANGDVEGFGIVALEANLHGIPVVGAKYCGVEEAVDHLSSGYLVDGDNPEEILEGINYCISNFEKLKNGSKLWVQNHQWKYIVQEYIKLLD